MGVQEAKEQLLALIDTHFSNNPKELAEFIHFTEQTLHKRFEQVMVDAEPDSLQKQVWYRPGPSTGGFRTYIAFPPLVVLSLTSFFSQERNTN